MGRGFKISGAKKIELILKFLKVEFEKEYKFSDKRKFRFDFAIVDKKIAIEYEGLFSDKSGHTTIKGYVKDCEKYNLAQIEGWKVLRYTAVNLMDFEKDLTELGIIKKPNF